MQLHQYFTVFSYSNWILNAEFNFFITLVDTEKE
jgi:hypothetical protein